MSEELIKRLRDQVKDAFAKQYSLGMFKLCDEAAGEIERLRAIAVERMEWFKQAANNVERLDAQLASARKALGTIYVLADDTPANEGQLDRIQEIAKAALTDEKCT